MCADLPKAQHRQGVSAAASTLRISLRFRVLHPDTFSHSVGTSEDRARCVEEGGLQARASEMPGATLSHDPKMGAPQVPEPPGRGPDRCSATISPVPHRNS
jgi:hypothetical protein